MNKKGIAPAFLIGMLFVFILMLIMLVAIVAPGSDLGNSFLNMLFGSEGCTSPVLMADDIEKEIKANHLKQAAGLYNEFKECHSKLDILEVNKNIQKAELDKVIERAKTL